jgi:3-dehydroquinate synthase
MRAARPVAAAAAAAPSAAAAPATTLTVDLGDRSYPIHVGEGLLDNPALYAPALAGKRALIVTNDVVGPLLLDRVTAALTAAGASVDAVVLPDGEAHKDVDTVAKVWDAALAGRHGRDTTFVALGGGVVGDMCGFAAAAYQRGVAFIQVPTTLMAAVDSSVGGKTGVNRPAGKNMVGAFHQPTAVIVDVAALDTLPDRELASGLSEVVKYGLIRDAPLFEWLEGGGAAAVLARDRAALVHAVTQSCVNKAAVVAADEREGGVRATLNLGHTFGHAVETATGYGAWLHGEAVAAGTAMAADLSARLGWIEPGLAERAVTLLRDGCRLPVEVPPSMTPARFKDLMAVDKKVKDGVVRLVLLKGALGGCVVTGDYDAAALDATLARFCGGGK